VGTTHIGKHGRHARAALRVRHIKVAVEPSLRDRAAADRTQANDVGVSHEWIVTAPPP
jgi:hypothetical protein